MADQDRYVTLISSLPPHVEGLFGAKQTPISRLRLEERLRMLRPGDAHDLSLIENAIHWDRMPLGVSDREMVERGRRILSDVNSPVIHEIIGWRLELRTLVAALRRRNAGETAPPSKRDWGFGRWMRRIEANWREPAFALEGVYPWLPELSRLFAERDHLGIERFLLSLIWTYYGRISGEHYFDFEAVVIYVLRWDVIDRWSSYSREAAEIRFNELVRNTLAAYEQSRR